MDVSRVKNTYSIDEVAEIAKVNSFTLRNWEERYQLFSPVRDANGRRIFTEIETMRAVAAALLVEKDFKIGKIATSLIEAENMDLLLSEYLEGESFRTFREQSLDGLMQLDSVPFRMTMDLMVTNYNFEFIADHFIYPLFKRVEELAMSNKITHYQERFARHHLCSRVHRMIGVAQINRARPYNDKKALITGLPGNRFEDTLLLVNLMLERYNWRACYFGPELPIDEIDQAVKATGSDVVILAGNNLTIADYQKHANALEQLSAPVIIGGKISTILRMEGHQNTLNVELSPLRPGPLSRFLSFKVGKSL